MTPQNGVGPSVLRAIIGTAFEAKWAPDLQVVIDGAQLQGVASLAIKTRDENGNTDSTVVTLTFAGSAGSGSQRTATISRKATVLAANATNDGFTATLLSL